MLGLLCETFAKLYKQFWNKSWMGSKSLLSYSIILIAVLGLFLLSGCQTHASQNTVLKQTPVKKEVNNTVLQKVTSTVKVVQNSNITLHNTMNLQAIPLGDGKVSTEPKKGYVYSCQTSFRGGGAQHNGNWIHNNTWNLSQKIHVEGNVSWPNAYFSVLEQGNKLIIDGNGLPVNEPTGIYPIRRNDPAHQIDANPNSVQAQNISVDLPVNPVFAAKPSCVPMGPVGIALDGVMIYNALDDGGRDAVAHEVQDLCNGHPQSAGEYHYHGPSPCMPNITKPNALVGYALDGFGIYSGYYANGTQINSSELDACHGMTSVINWHGKMVSMYHYVITDDYPYTIGCFRGTPVKISANQQGGQTAVQQNTQTTTGPPQGAIDAYSGKSEGTSCSFQTPNGTKTGLCHNTQSGLACVLN